MRGRRAGNRGRHASRAQRVSTAKRACPDLKECRLRREEHEKAPYVHSEHHGPSRNLRESETAQEVPPMSHRVSTRQRAAAQSTHPLLRRRISFPAEAQKTHFGGAPGTQS